MPYSSLDEIQRFTNELVAGEVRDINRNGATPDRQPMFVLDIDGNIALGHNPAPGVVLKLTLGDDPKTQAIPTGVPLKNLLEQGKVEQAIFSVKPMDSRLPPELVNTINRANDEERPFDIVLLTSRDTKDALKILEWSGVKDPKRTTLVGDSGAVLWLGGKKQDVLRLDNRESRFLSGLQDEKHLSAMEKAVDSAVASLSMEPQKRPPLFVESKGIATNIHYGEILKHYGQREGSPLDLALGGLIRSGLEEYTQTSGMEAQFKTLDGPATVELKHKGIDKGKGLEAVVNAALEAGYRPSSVIFGGDDICKRDAAGHVSHGTDYAAFKAAPELAKKTGIPFYTLHTQHPASGELSDPSPVPAPGKDASHAGISPDLTLPTPRETAGLVVEVIEKSRERAENIDRDARRRANLAAIGAQEISR